jgi:hypothetical protein
MQEVGHGVEVPDSTVQIAEAMRRREMQARFFGVSVHDVGKFLPSHRSVRIQAEQWFEQVLGYRASLTQQGHREPVLRMNRRRGGCDGGCRVSRTTCVLPYAKLAEYDAMIIVTRSRIG